ncbi:protein C3orf33 [Hylaeus anthracinus]|uniref:protein C3orf33 n=1 Tax=Hylaeus anthracinus TaxID=313031 RepID=UPI0023B9A32C|nr:protein C3orf33 [Hylaeus anthracinus]XP_054010981.1 protein C3orf33 [Hylaeus anthracinus]XP_054010982.1 protein C3orf33 [Hylaeus anthracinus]XP_054010983.1 protein C3orf33 [Hylaeus anthracinus]XP_054010984.1 protein C3orf33 [Hylaeus anthracinus]
MMGSEEKPNILERFIIFSETHSETIKIVSYGVASMSLVIALYQIRPFAKFRKPSSVPSHFLHNKVPLEGTVIRVEPSCGTLLMVDHKPLIPLPRLSNSNYLPVKIAGVNVTANGISWLQTIVCGKSITFTPLAKEKEYLNCLVTMLQQNQKRVTVGEELVELGFATVTESSLKPTLQNKEIVKYQKCLLNAQKRAQRKRNGFWHFAKHSTILWKIEQSFYKKLKSILPVYIVQRFNI